MIRDNSRREVPRTSNDLISRSSDTEGSPASIFAMRDWLDRRRCARAAWVRLPRARRSRRPMASRTLRSIYAASSALRRRNSRAVPTLHPCASSLRRFCLRTVILLQSSGACLDNGLRRRSRLLAEYFQNHHGVGVRPVHDSPVCSGITDPKLVTSRAHNGHRPRPRQAKRLPLLQQTKQITGLDPGSLGEWRRLDLAAEPHERPVARCHASMLCQIRHVVKSRRGGKVLT
jgi:hypothetical protein